MTYNDVKDISSYVKYTQQNRFKNKLSKAKKVSMIYLYIINKFIHVNKRLYKLS